MLPASTVRIWFTLYKSALVHSQGCSGLGMGTASGQPVKPREMNSFGRNGGDMEGLNIGASVSPIDGYSMVWSVSNVVSAKLAPWLSGLLD